MQFVRYNFVQHQPRPWINNPSPSGPGRILISRWFMEIVEIYDYAPGHFSGFICSLSRNRLVGKVALLLRPASLSLFPVSALNCRNAKPFTIILSVGFLVVSKRTEKIEKMEIINSNIYHSRRWYWKSSRGIYSTRIGYILFNIGNTVNLYRVLLPIEEPLVLKLFRLKVKKFSILNVMKYSTFNRQEIWGSQKIYP